MAFVRVCLTDRFMLIMLMAILECRRFHAQLQTTYVDLHGKGSTWDGLIGASLIVLVP